MGLLNVVSRSISPHFKIKNAMSPTHWSVDAVSMFIREQLMARRRVFDLEIDSDAPASALIQRDDYLDTFFAKAYAIKKPFVDNDFDYLKRSVKQIQCTVVTTATLIKLTYTVQYATTAIQEQQISTKIADLKNELNLNALATDFEKAKCVYDYICSNVSYDHDFQKYTAYDALIDGKAVCSGCAILLYRLLRSVNVSVRIITGRSRGENHAWNIVKIGSRWYNMDATWDLYEKWDLFESIQKKFIVRYDWFLKGELSFPDHVRGVEYDNAAFHKNHLMSRNDYR